MLWCVSVGEKSCWRWLWVRSALGMAAVPCSWKPLAADAPVQALSLDHREVLSAFGLSCLVPLRHSLRFPLLFIFLTVGACFPKAHPQLGLSSDSDQVRTYGFD